MGKNEPRRKPPLAAPSKPVIPNWLIVIVVVWVMLMWTGSIVYSTTNPKWAVPPSVHATVPIVVTGIVGYLAVKGRGNGG